jgi:hypothetical protein
MTNGWGTIHPVPDKAPPLQAEEEGPPIYKELIPGVIHIVDFTPLRETGTDRILLPIHLSPFLPQPGRDLGI